MRQVLSVVFILVYLAHAQSSLSATRPNFVFFLVDDLGYMDIGANNAETFYETPNVDRLAQEGMRFTNGYAANPVCSPTRYSIMTGKYPTRVDATDWFTGRREGRFRPARLNDRMPVEEITLAEALQTAGYRTAFLGKWHLGPSEPFWPESLMWGGCYLDLSLTICTIFSSLLFAPPHLHPHPPQLPAGNERQRQ